MTDYKKVIVKLFICLLLAVLLIPLIFVGVKQDTAEAYIRGNNSSRIFGTSGQAISSFLSWNAENGVVLTFTGDSWASANIKSIYLFFYSSSYTPIASEVIYFTPQSTGDGRFIYHICPISYNIQNSIGSFGSSSTFSLLISIHANNNTNKPASLNFVYDGSKFSGFYPSAPDLVNASYVKVVICADLNDTPYDLSLLSSLSFSNFIMNSSTFLLTSQFITSSYNSTYFDNGYLEGYEDGTNVSMESWDNLLPSIMGSYASFFLIVLGGIEIFGTSLLVLLGSIGALAVVFIVVSKLRG